MTITEFLEARIAEDEAEAQKGGHHNDTGAFARDNYGCLLVQPARVLAECAAKRAIIEGWEPWFSDDGMTAEQYDLGEQTAVHHAVHALAAVYSDHPDYQPEWTQEG